MIRPDRFTGLTATLAAVTTLCTAALLTGTAMLRAAPRTPTVSSGSVPYECDEIPTAELVEIALDAVAPLPNGLVARMLGAAEAPTSTEPDWPARILPLLAEAAAEPREAYTAWAHIAVQNAAYRLARHLSFELRSLEARPPATEPAATTAHDPDVDSEPEADTAARHAAAHEAHALSLAVIDHWALPAIVLDSLAARPHPVVERWLGPAENWVERRASFCGSTILLHEAQHFGAFAFRPVRSGSVRALIALMTAFDTEGHPHVTPLVHRAELRFGLEPTAPACVLDLDAGALDAAGTPALERVGFSDLRGSMFIRPSGDERVTCGGCHSAGSSFNAVDVTEPAEIAALNAARRELFLAYAAEQAAEVRTAR